MNAEFFSEILGAVAILLGALSGIVAAVNTAKTAQVDSALKALQQLTDAQQKEIDSLKSDCQKKDEEIAAQNERIERLMDENGELRAAIDEMGGRGKWKKPITDVIL